MAEKGKEKVTMMKLKVDLECAKCYKKVKKVLCQIPQIRDQLFDEKSNIVIIKVVCCSPERIMDKLCSKGGGSIKTIEIVQPPKPPQPQPQAQPPPAQKPKDAPKAAEKPKDAAEKPKQPEKAKESEKPKQAEKPKEAEKPKQQEKPKESDKPAAAKPAAPAPAQQAQAPAAAPKQAGPPPQAMPMMSQGQPVAAMYYGPSYYDGFGGGPAFSGYGMPQPPPHQYETYGRPVYDSWGGGPPPSYRQCNPNRCDYFSEENPQSCSIM